MKSKNSFGALMILGVLACLTPAPAKAHHSFTAEFDGSKTITLTGTLTKVDWVNPHVYLYVDVKDAAGKVTNWSIEMGPTVALHRYGARRNMFVEGQTVVIQAYPAKDGTKSLAGFLHIKFQDGTEFNYKNADEPPPPDAK